MTNLVENQMTSTRQTETFNPMGDWTWLECIEFADGHFESVWANPYEGEDEVMFTEATPEEIASHKRIEQMRDMPEGETIPADWFSKHWFGNM